MRSTGLMTAAVPTREVTQGVRTHRISTEFMKEKEKGEKGVSIRTCAEEFDEVARLGFFLDFFHGDGTLVDDELALGHAW